MTYIVAVTGRCSRLFLSRLSLFSSYLFIYMYTYSPILENGYSGILFLYRINEGWCDSCTKNDIYVDRSEAESDTLTVADGYSRNYPGQLCLAGSRRIHIK